MRGICQLAYFFRFPVHQHNMILNLSFAISNVVIRHRTPIMILPRKNFLLVSIVFRRRSYCKILSAILH